MMRKIKSKSQRKLNNRDGRGRGVREGGRRGTGCRGQGIFEQGEILFVQRPYFAIFNRPPVPAHRGCNSDPNPPRWQPPAEPAQAMVKETNCDPYCG